MIYYVIDELSRHVILMFEADGDEFAMRYAEIDYRIGRKFRLAREVEKK